MKKILRKSLELLAVFGVAVTSTVASSTCMLFMHQPKMPENYKSLRKF